MTSTVEVRMGSATEADSSRRRVNWTAAKAWYLALDQDRRTLKAVADRFKVSDSRVSQVAARDGWAAAAEDVDRRVQRRAVTSLVRNRAERLARALEVSDRATDLALAMLPLDQAGQLDPAKVANLPRVDQLLEKIPGLFRMAELAAGEATDRLEVAQVQPVLVAFARIAVLNAPADRRGDVMRELQAASAGLVPIDVTSE